MANVSTTAGGVRRKTPFAVELYRSAVGKKYVMAVTGVGLVLFAFGHMIGNLKMYLGSMPATSKYAYHIDEYGEFLRKLGEPILPHTVFLWITRLGLIGAFGLHMHAAFSLTVMNRKARTTNYQSKRDYVAASSSTWPTSPGALKASLVALGLGARCTTTSTPASAARS
jgi:succinate dehydrogenase / fumarate reductase, cytochrome b subunit